MQIAFLGSSETFTNECFLECDKSHIRDLYEYMKLQIKVLGYGRGNFYSLLAIITNSPDSPTLLDTTAGADPGFYRGGRPASEADSCRRSGVELHEQSKLSMAGVQGPLKGPRSSLVFSAQICIFPHSKDPFSLISDIYFDTRYLKFDMLSEAMLKKF